MRESTEIRKQVAAVVLAAALVLTLAGCGSEGSSELDAALNNPGYSQEAEDPEPEPIQTVNTAPAVPVPSAVDDGQFNEALPPIEASMARSDEMLMEGNYEGAVDALIRLEYGATAMTRDQKVSQVERMYKLQRDIARALDSGDPNAQRAARLLMQHQAAQLAR